MNDFVQLGCYNPLDNTEVIDQSDLQGKNENLKAISVAIIDWYNVKLRQIEGNIENLSISYPFKLISEMIRDYSGLKNVFSALNLPFLPLNILPLRNIELKTDITDMAIEFIKADMFICDTIVEILENVEDVFGDHQYNLKLHRDSKEIFDFDGLVLSIEVQEENYDLVLQLWDEIEERVEDLLNIKKEQGYDASRLDKISKKLLIEVKKAKNV